MSISPVRWADSRSIRSIGVRAGVRWVFGGGALILSLCLGGIAGAQIATWRPIGPNPTTRGQVENIADGEVVGAVKAIAPHPTNQDVVFIGAVNGGIWMTDDATSPHPTWQSQTDAQRSLSIGALEFDPTDAGARTLVAGIGIFSSLAVGGSLTGLLRTTDGGANWTPLDGGGTLTGVNVSGVAPRGATIVLAANAASNFANLGIWRSTDTGASWAQVSGSAASGLPAGPSFDLAGDPGNRNRLYTNGGNSGLYRSDDAGSTWVKKSNAAMDSLIASSVNVKISAARPSWVYVAIVDGGELAGVFVSRNNGDAWTAMDLPMLPEGGIHPGGQGQIHLAIVADPIRPNLVYIGGDRQDGDFPNVPNSIGALDYSGILFRGDADQPSGSQWVHLTHSNTLGAPGGGTAHGSAPHADSRALEVAANGVLLHGCDGGIYRRTNPQDNTGDWFSINGNLQSTEFHAVAYDANAHVVIGGAQDTGTPEEQTRGGPRWQSVSTGDGGVVAVDTRTIPGRSIRYTSYYSLGNFRRQVYDAGNALISEVFPNLSVLGGGNPLAPQFYTPIRVNSVRPAQLIIGAGNSVYESLNQGDSITEVGRGIVVNGTGPTPIAYGAADDVNALYVGSDRAQVFVRMGASPAPLTASASYPGGLAVGIAIDPSRSRTAYVADSGRVYRTTDAGATWSDITGNLATIAPGSLRSIAYSTRDADGAVVVGTDHGVYIAPGPGFNAWSPLAPGLPNAPVFHIEFNAQDGIYLAGTMGRGAWVLKP